MSGFCWFLLGFVIVVVPWGMYWMFKKAEPIDGDMK